MADHVAFRVRCIISLADRFAPAVSEGRPEKSSEKTRHSGPEAPGEESSSHVEQKEHTGENIHTFTEVGSRKDGFDLFVCLFVYF